MSARDSTHLPTHVYTANQSTVIWHLTLAKLAHISS